jgi:hypothetical protein
MGVGVQQEIAPQIAVEVTYNRRIWSNFFLTHNRALTAADYDEVTLIAPRDERLPNGGGYPVTFLTRNNRSAIGATDSYYTTSDDFGGETHYWHGVDISVNARMKNGLSLQGGTSTGRGVADTCDMLTARFGRPMAPTLGSAAVPVIAVGTRGRGTGLRLRRALPDQRAWPRLLHRAEGGRPRERHLPLAGECAARRRPGHERGVADGDLPHERRAVPGGDRTAAGDRLAQAGREPRATWHGVRRPYQQRGHARRQGAAVRKYRANVGLDVYNLMNSNTPTAYENVYDPNPAVQKWMQPTRCCCRGSCGSTSRSTSESQRM